MDGIILNQIVVNGGKVEYRFTARGVIADYLKTDTMFLHYDTDVSDVPESILTIPFVSSLLPLMWLTDTVMWVKELDLTYYESVSRIREEYRNIYNSCPLKGNLVPAKTPENELPRTGKSLLLFSGGIDANTTYARIHEKEPLLVNIQGWYETPESENVPADADFRDIADFAKARGLGTAFVKSNFAVLVNNDKFNKEIKPKLGDSWWHGFQHSMSFISIAAPIAYKKGIETIYIASSVPMREYVKCASYVTTDGAFRFAGTGKCIHDGSELTRQDKVHTLVGFAEGLGGDYPIRVCSFNDRNCCSCDKCFRSILGLVAEGADIRKYGFYIDGSLKDHFNSIMEERAQTFNIRGESSLHWPAIRRRMQENYDKIPDKEFVDWFMTYDFQKARKRALKNYYRKNFFKIVKRKLFPNK